MRSKYTYTYSKLAEKLGISERTSPGIKGNWRITSVVDDPTTRTVEVHYEDNDRVNDGPDGQEANERDPQGVDWSSLAGDILDFTKTFYSPIFPVLGGDLIDPVPHRWSFHHETAEERAARLERELSQEKNRRQRAESDLSGVRDQLTEIRGLAEEDR